MNAKPRTAEELSALLDRIALTVHAQLALIIAVAAGRKSPSQGDWERAKKLAADAGNSTVTGLYGQPG